MELSKAQDIEAGDGTTTVVVLAGSLLNASQKLLAKGRQFISLQTLGILSERAPWCFFAGIHPTTISEAFQKALDKALNVLTDMSTPLKLSDRESLLKSATTSLCSKVGC